MKKTTLALFLSVLSYQAFAAPEDRAKDCSNNRGADCALEAVSKNVDKELTAVRNDPIKVHYNSVNMDLWKCDKRGDKYYTPGTNQLCSRVQPVVMNVPVDANKPNGAKQDKAFVEAAGIFNALNYELSWDGAQQRILATRDINGQRDSFIMYLGSRKVYVYKDDLYLKSFTATAAPFVATSNTYTYDRTMVPLTLIGKASGASVDWEKSDIEKQTKRRTIHVNSSKPYSEDETAKNGKSYFYHRDHHILYTDRLFQGPDYTGPSECGKTDSNGTFLPQGHIQCAFKCDAGTFDPLLRRCVDNGNVLSKAVGNAEPAYVTACKESGASGCINQQTSDGTFKTSYDAYQKGEDYYGFTPSTAPGNWIQVVNRFKDNPETYNVPFENHDMSGLGMYPANGGLESADDYGLSETNYLPFVMSARRQTDQAVRALYELLPEDVRKTTAFVMPDRVAKNPIAYADYMNKFFNRVDNVNPKLYVLGSFMGIRNIDSKNHPYYQATMLRHARELFKLKNTLLLATTMGYKPENIQVIYSMGDSLNDFAKSVQANLQKRVDNIADAAGINRFKISMGADEVAHVAFAATLPKQTVFVGLYHNFNVEHTYDGKKMTKAIIAEKFAEMNLTPVYDESKRLDADFEVYIYNRHPGTYTKIDNACELALPDCHNKAAAARALQDKADAGDVAGSPHFGKTFREYIGGQIDSALAQRAGWTRDQAQGRMAVLDLRMPNGAWNIKSVPYSASKLLHYSGWGTMANSLGMSVASSKILVHKSRESELGKAIAAANARRMTIEAIVQDNFVIGYQFGQRTGTTALPSLRDRFTSAGINYSNYQSYETEAELKKAFGIVNTHANSLMETYKSLINSVVDYKVRVTPQFWRHFEQEVHLTPVKAHEIFAPGVYRTKFKGTELDPNQDITLEAGAVKASRILETLAYQ